uniref:Pco077147 n=1 Tax=Arundo donax TaxID=35708 RepID=A0A0A9EBN3_ARUDO
MVNFLKFFVCISIIFISIRMELLCKRIICLLYIWCRSILAHSKHIIVIPCIHPPRGMERPARAPPARAPPLPPWIGQPRRTGPRRGGGGGEVAGEQLARPGGGRRGGKPGGGGARHGT